MAIDSTHHVLIDRRREVSVTGGAPIVAGSVESDVVALTLQAPEQWEGLALALTFHNGNSKVTVAWDGESEVTVPWEAVQAVGWLGVALEGVEVDGGETVQRSLVARKDMLIRVVEAGPTDGVDPGSATPDLVDQAIAATAAANAAASSANVAAQSATDAASGAEGAASDARSAAQTATDAATVAGTAAASANAAATSADEAAQTATEAAGQVNEAIENAEDAADSANAAAQAATEAMEGIETYTDNVLKGSSSGAIATVDDAWPSTLLGLTVYGNSVQESTTGKNLAILERGTLDVATGAETTSTTRVRTNYIPITPGNTYIASTNGWDIRNGILYDSNKEYIRYSIYPNKQGILIVNNNDAAYIRLIYSHSNTNETCLPSDYWYQLESGSTATAYEPYTGGVPSPNPDYPQPVRSVAGAACVTAGATSDPSSGTSYPLTLVDDQGVEHELRSLPDGTRDELVINADGSGTLAEWVDRAMLDGDGDTQYTYNCQQCTGDASYTYIYSGKLDGRTSTDLNASMCDKLIAGAGNQGVSYAPVGETGSLGGSASSRLRLWLLNESLGIDWSSSPTRAQWWLLLSAWLAENKPTIYFKLATPRTYTIPAVNMPQLPATVSNAWIDATDSDGAAIGAELEIGYRRDVNVVINRLEEAIADLVSA